MKRGQQRTYPAHTGFRHLLHLIGALDWQTDTVHTLPVERKHSDSFIAFVEWLCLTVYPDQPLLLVLDNVSYHRSASVLALLSLLHPRVQVLWLPLYSPDLNPIERYWLHLKCLAYANRLFPSLTHLLDHIRLCVSFQNMEHHPDRLSFAKSFR
jgi:transposase